FAFGRSAHLDALKISFTEPSKQEFKRDLVRLRGGKNDFLVSVELDINALRTFQSRDKSWPRDKDPFKPVPEGFKISPGRKKIPPR
ncbi:hypothetical protein O6C87_01505, partial [Legionella pneumophila]